MPRQPFPWRDVARYAPLTIVGGGLIGLMLAGFEWRFRMIAQGAIIGFTCFFFAILAEFFLHDWFERKPGAWWRRAITYFLASQFGWVFGVFVGMTLIWRQPLSEARFPKAVALVVIVLGIAGTLVGLGIFGYEQLKLRLQASLEQLKEKEIAEKELELARAFQARLLPAPEIAADGYRISGRNLPARWVAGDFYDVFRYGDGAVGIAIADVAGKGVAASLIMASVKAVLPLLAGTRSVEEALGALNEKLTGELSKREFVALALARYEPASGALSVANAGLPDPYLVRADGAIDTVSIPGQRLPLGLRKSIVYDSARLTLGHGEALLLMSDGLPEATTAAGEPLGYELLTSILRERRGVDAILERLHELTANSRDDDQTLVMLERL